MTSSSMEREPSLDTASNDTHQSTKLLTPQHGSTSIDGKCDTEISAILNRMASRFVPSDRSPQHKPLTTQKSDSASSPTIERQAETLASSLNNHEKTDLVGFLTMCFDAMRTYGKTTAQLENAITFFVSMLDPYPMVKVKEAFRQWVTRHNEMPTPADIINLIDPPPPTPDWAGYVGIKQKIRDGSIYVTLQERNYVAWCEKYVAEQLSDYDARQAAKAEITNLETRMVPVIAP